jgi:hypothetical protein
VTGITWRGLWRSARSASRARRGDLAAIVTALDPWFGFLLAQAKPFGGGRLADYALPGNYLDATPFNLVETDQGLVPIDMEWRLDRAIPLGWVVVRSVLHSLCGRAGFERDAVTVTPVVDALCARRGLAVDRDEIAEWLARERELQGLVSDRALPHHVGDMLSRQIVPLAERVLEQDARIGELTQTVAGLRAQIDLIYHSRSWRYSYPIRLLGGLSRGEPTQAPVVPVAARDGLASGIKQLSGLAERVKPLGDLKRYGGAIVLVIATFLLTRLLIASGVHVPRMLLYIAAVAIAARVGGLGPGMLAMAASVFAIVLSAMSQHPITHEAAFAQRLVVFLVCAMIGIAVSAPRTQEERTRQRRSRNA